MPWKGTGTYTIQTSWSHHGKELISTSTFRTKNGKNAELIVARKLADGGNTLVLSQTLKIEGERQERYGSFDCLRSLRTSFFDFHLAAYNFS
jgi:hypothetical protein